MDENVLGTPSRRLGRSRHLGDIPPGATEGWRTVYCVIKAHAEEGSGLEARLAEIDTGYSVGTWDLDCEEYYPPLRIFPHSVEGALEKATAYFERYIKPKPITFLV